MIAFLVYWMYIILIAFTFFIPGLAIANSFKNLSAIEKLGVSSGFSIAILAFLIPFFAFKLDFLAQLLFTGIMIASLWYLLKKRSEFKFDVDAKFLLFVLVISLVSRYFLQTLWEYPVMGGDWFLHTFRVPYAFEQGNWVPPEEKTPLFGLLIYSYHNLFGISLYQYWFSQIISVVINSLYIFPIYLIAKKVFGDQVAKTSALFMLVTPFLIFNTIYTWPKNAAMYGILMMIYFLFFSEHYIRLRYPLAGFFAGLGFLFHNYALFYIGLAVLLLIYKEKIYRELSKNGFKKLAYFLLILFLVLAPYFVWAYPYGTVSTSRTIYYPIAVKGYESAFNQTPAELWEIFKDTPLKEIIMTRISNAIVTFTPATLPINRYATNLRTYNPFFYYALDYPGALSTLMYLLLVIWFISYILGKTNTDSVLVYFLLLPWVLIIILYGWREWGLITGFLHPTIPILIIIGFNELYKWNNKLNNKLFYVIFISAVIEDGIFGVLIHNFYYVEGGIQHLAKTGQQFASGFQVSNFVSAHFLLNRNIDILVCFLISIGIIILAYSILYINKNRWCKQSSE